MLYIIPSHLRILCRTLTRVLGGILQWAFLRPRCGRSVTARPRTGNVLASSVIANQHPHSVVSVGRFLLLTPHSVSFFGST